MTKTAKLTETDLMHFTGSEYWYRHALNRNVLFTDGARYVADEGGAYWLLDSIAIAQLYKKRVAAEEFQVWKLAVRSDRTATLTCENGNYNVVLPSSFSSLIFQMPRSRCGLRTTSSTFRANTEEERP